MYHHFYSNPPPEGNSHMTGQLPLTTPANYGHKTFLYSESCNDLDRLEADIAFLGIPYGAPYAMANVANDQSTAPDAIRQVTDRAVRSLERYDFDLGGPIYDGTNVRLVDCGNVPGNMHDFADHVARAETAVRKILAAGARPLIAGGDHAIPIPVLQAFDSQDPITIVQIDAHIDWRQEVNGETQGLSSVIRRASEMDHVGEIFQIGLRSSGSARNEDVEAAKAYGAHLITAYELYEVGMKAILDRIPDNGRYYLTIDADGLDPSIMPAVEGPAPGGVNFPQMHTLIHGLVRKGDLVGMDIVEITPSRDLNRISLLTAARLFVNAIGAWVRS
jgi:agmatinase